MTSPESTLQPLPTWQPSAFGVFATPKAALALAALWCLLTVVFHAMPDMDIAVSRLFFDDACVAGGMSGCAAFPYAASRVLEELRQTMQLLPELIIAGLLAWYAADIYWGRTLADTMMRARGTLVLAFALGPGLFVNGLMKAHMGRPRPYETDLFGGDLPFVPAGEYSAYCASNCSFVSGEASEAFWLIGLLVLVAPQHRRAVALALLPVVLFFTLLRVAFGAHYLSDALLGGLSSLVVLSALALALEQAWRLPRRLLLPRCGL